MAIDKNSTGYTFLFSIIMVVVVGTSLAYTSLSLKERQRCECGGQENDGHSRGDRRRCEPNQCQ